MACAYFMHGAKSHSEIGDKHTTLTRNVGILLLSDATSWEEKNRLLHS
jgi:hypothetical protein